MVTSFGEAKLAGTQRTNLSVGNDPGLFLNQVGSNLPLGSRQQIPASLVVNQRERGG